MPLGMLGLAYASVPLYELFCQVTGYGGTTQRADKAGDAISDREIVVQFDANVNGLPWKFHPEVPQVHVKLGETAIVNFVAENTGSLPTVGTARYNVAPDAFGSYFNKIECFCFTEQTLEPGQRIEMPVQFFLSPDLLDDRQMKAVHTVTLSYTFFPVPGQGQPVAQVGGDAAGNRM
jgi:cytochrome c oxidase assembly protein subunit 11